MGDRRTDLPSDFIIEWLQRAKEAKENAKNSEHVAWDALDQLSKSTWLLGIFQVVMIILFATVGNGTESLDAATAPGTATQGYNMFIGVEIMMFVGFGYLMTFLKWYGIGAVGLTMMITAVALQWAVFTESFWDQLYNNVHDWHQVEFTIYSLLDSLYAVSAVLISFGALIGKISPLQLLVMAIIELCCHSFNYEILMTGGLAVVDVGGTYSDHMFGAYFGLAVSYVLGKNKNEPEFGNTSDIFSLLGTVFLWIYWPSFVIGADIADSQQQARGMVNTILALSASTVCAFWLSSVLSINGRYRPVDIQNATLAGGVAIGATANLTMSAFGAIMIGAAAGIVSVVGYNMIQPVLEEKLGLHDSCGIHNLHAMPSVVGALASVIIAGYKGQHSLDREHDKAIYGENAWSQWYRQWVGIVVCMSFAIITGTITGYILKAVYPKMQTSDTKAFNDNAYWEVAEDYGRSLYSELAMLVKESDASGIKSTIVESITEWSSHTGRRTGAVTMEQLSASMNGRKMENRAHQLGVVPGQPGGVDGRSAPQKKDHIPLPVSDYAAEDAKAAASAAKAAAALSGEDEV